MFIGEGGNWEEYWFDRRLNWRQSDRVLGVCNIVLIQGVGNLLVVVF